jgi:hypothetical protein
MSMEHVMPGKFTKTVVDDIRTTCSLCRERDVPVCEIVEKEEDDWPHRAPNRLYLCLYCLLAGVKLMEEN